ncbi:MAG: ATPase [Spirochaetaceae bacterium 4572_59]|nr:MAG: ATPase [Spirochaetaceae bacterium 4572_59]
MNTEIVEKTESVSGIVIKKIRDEISKVIVGQEKVVDRLLLGMICNQHILLEGVPGLAKTLLVTTLAKVVQADSGRIQFTPDLLPADLTGTLIYNPAESSFYSRKGPVFTNILLADEINRAPAKVQSALLEAMQERQVTIGDESYPLEELFMVLATQNPVEQEGTYPLPEAQVDRFMMKLIVDYPKKHEELQIIRSQSKKSARPEAKPVCTARDILKLRDLAEEVYIDAKIEEYIIDIIQASRKTNEYIQFGASPRASIFLCQAARGLALMQGRNYVTPQDIREIVPDVLRHRIVISYEAEAEGITSDDLIQKILDSVPAV